MVSIIRCVRGVSHTVSYYDTKAVDLLHLYPTQISRLIVIRATIVNFTPLINLRSLTIKYGTFAQLDEIHPEHFPMLEILHIDASKSKNSLSDQTKSQNDLFQLVLSNGFPRLRICTVIGIEALNPNETWTGSPALRVFILTARTPLPYDQIRSLCPNLRQFKRASNLQTDLPIGMILFYLS